MYGVWDLITAGGTFNGNTDGGCGILDGNTETGSNECDGKAVSGAAIAFTECIGRDGNRIESWRFKSAKTWARYCIWCRRLLKSLIFDRLPPVRGSGPRTIPLHGSEGWNGT
jgi:hypothetical protein